MVRSDVRGDGGDRASRNPANGTGTRNRGATRPARTATRTSESPSSAAGTAARAGRAGACEDLREDLREAPAQTGAALVGDGSGGRDTRHLGCGYLYYQHLNGNIKKEKLNLGDTKIAEPTPNAFGQTPLNILLIGSDARDTEENQKLGGAKDTFNGPPLADVQMLLHLSADRTNMSVVSMPRDTLLPIPKCTDPDNGDVYEASTSAMTNDSLRRGGPGCTVATWQELTGIRIDHFMMVDFSGVVSMADAIGGVPVCVTDNIESKDSQGHGSGLKLEKGTTYIKGKQALQWLRTRYGFEDGSDIARAKAQHQYMNSMVRELRENATITNPNKLRRLAEEATEALTVDEGLGDVATLYDLSTELRKVEPPGSR